MGRVFIGLICIVFSLSADNVYATFSVEANKNASLAFDASGVVKEVFVDVASRVKKGAKLAQLVDDDTRASIESAKAALESAEVTLKFAQRDYERQLKVRNLIDEGRFDAYEKAYETAKANLSEIKANLHLKEALLRKTTLYAPFDGVIYEKSVEVGDVVSGMMLRTVFKIQSAQDRKLILEFDQKYYKSVKVGQIFQYKLDGSEKIHSGVITKLFPSASLDSKKLKAEVSAKDLLVGLFGDGYIITGEKK